MNISLCFFLLLISLYRCSISQEQNEYYENVNVLIMNDTNYLSMVESFPFLMIALYTPWCGSCHILSSEFVKTAYILKEGNNTTVRLAQVDLSVNPHLSKVFSPEQYPTILFYYDGVLIKYTEELDSDSLIDFINKMMGIPFPVVDTVEEVNSTLRNNSRVMVTTMSLSDERIISIVKEFYLKPSIKWINCHSEECLKYYNKSSLILLKKFDEPVVYFQNENNFTVENIDSFLDIYSVEIGGEFDSYYTDFLFNGNKPSFLYFRNALNSTQTDKDKIIKEIGRKYRKDMYFFILDITSKAILTQVANYFKITESLLPRAQIVNFTSEGNYYTYIMNKSNVEFLTKDSFDSFISDFFSGNLQREPIGEAPPKRQTSSYTYLVSSTFFEKVVNSNKTFCVLFIDLSCGYSDYCIKLVALWEKLSNKYIDNDNINFGLFNYGKNELINFDNIPQQFPSIMLFVKGDKNKVIEYKGEGLLIKIENWIAEQLDW